MDDEARSLIGEADDLPATPEPSFPFVPRIARLPRDRPLDRALDRQLERAPGNAAPAPEPEEERDTLTSLLEAVPSFRGDLVVPERPEPPAEEEPEAEEPPAASASAGAAPPTRTS